MFESLITPFAYAREAIGTLWSKLLRVFLLEESLVFRRKFVTIH